MSREVPDRALVAGLAAACIVVELLSFLPTSNASRAVEPLRPLSAVSAALGALASRWRVGHHDAGREL